MRDNCTRKKHETTSNAIKIFLTEQERNIRGTSTHDEHEHVQQTLTDIRSSVSLLNEDKAFAQTNGMFAITIY